MLEYVSFTKARTFFLFAGILFTHVIKPFFTVLDRHKTSGIDSVYISYQSFRCVQSLVDTTVLS